MEIDPARAAEAEAKAWELLLARLSRREYTEREVQRYLRQRDIAPELVRALLARATELGYLSNERAARIWAREWAMRGQGAVGIQRKLALLKGVKVSLEQVQDWLSEGDREPELVRAHAWVTRLYAGYAAEPATRRRAFAALTRRGFSVDITKRVLALPEDASPEPESFGFDGLEE
jgi:SOS response regulatory protein OraA/RecX